MSLRSFYCQGCGLAIARTELDNERCRSCGGTIFGLQPKPHSADTTLTEFDRAFLTELRIQAEDSANVA